MILVADTGPLIALAKIGKIQLLKNLVWQVVYIPPRVHKELWGKIGPESDAIEAALTEFIQVSTPKSVNSAIDIITAELGEGEKQVIRLGASIQQDVQKNLLNIRNSWQKKMFRQTQTVSYSP